MSSERSALGSEVDWVDRLVERDSQVLRALPFRRLARIPPPKSSGLPLGHELRILRRFVSGRTSSLDPSGLSSLYLAWLTPRERLLCRALVLREAIPKAGWDKLLGRAANSWMERELLAPFGGGWQSRFSIVPVEDMLLAVDPQESAFANKVHVGQDSMNLLHFMMRKRPRTVGRALDVGTGTGILLIPLARLAHETFGIELNPRAVAAARFNAAMNGVSGWRVERRDVFAVWDDVGRFDLVIWNAPFMFLPESEREHSLDGFGGDLGIGITLKFLRRLPDLIAKEGTAMVMTAAPILVNGENRLETELAARCQRLGLEARVHVLQAFWSVEFARFHREHGIDRFESVILELRSGSGRVTRVSPSLQFLSDGARRLLYRAQLGRSGGRGARPTG